MQAFNTSVHILVTSYRKRLADPDGICAKWAIDAICELGILSDDSAKEVAEVRYKQVKVKTESEERTVIRIEEVGDG